MEMAPNVDAAGRRALRQRSQEREKTYYCSPERSLSPGTYFDGSQQSHPRSSSVNPGQAARSSSNNWRGRAQSQAPPSSYPVKTVDGYAPNGWKLSTGNPPAGLLSHPLDSGAEDLFQCIFEKDQLVGLLAQPHGEVRGLVVTSPGAGGGPGPADPQGGGGGGTYGGCNVYRELATILPSQGIAVLLMHYPHGEPGGTRHTRVSRNADHLETLTNWYHDHIQQTRIPTILIGWSMGGAVVLEAAARMINAKRAQICGVATIASQTAGVLATSPHLIVKSGAKLLLMAGSADTCLSPNCTNKLARMAGVEPEIFPEEDHGVESAFGRLASWIPDSISQLFSTLRRDPARRSSAHPSPSRQNGTRANGDPPADADVSVPAQRNCSVRRSRSSLRGEVAISAKASCINPQSPRHTSGATPVQLESSSACCKLPKLRCSSRPRTADSMQGASVIPECANPTRLARNDSHGKSPRRAKANCLNPGHIETITSVAADSARMSRNGSRCRLPKLPGRPSTAPAPKYSALPKDTNPPQLGGTRSRCSSPQRETSICTRSQSEDRDGTSQGKSCARRKSPEQRNSSYVRDKPCTQKAIATWDTAHKSPDLRITDNGLVIQGPSQSKYSWHAAFVQTPAHINAEGSYRRFDFLIEDIGDGLMELGLATQNQAKKAALHWPGLKNTSAWTYASSAQRFCNVPGVDEATWSQPFGEPYGTGDIVSIEIDDGELRFGRNGCMQGTILNSLPAGKLFLGATLSTGSRVRLVSDTIQP